MARRSYKFDPLAPMRLAAVEALRTSRTRGSRHQAAPKNFLANLGTPPISPARHLCQEFFRDRRIEALDTQGFADPAAPRRWPSETSGAAIALPVFIRQGLWGARDGGRKGLQAAGASISIWQDGPASRRLRTAAGVGDSSLPAATRWRCCRSLATDGVSMAERANGPDRRCPSGAIRFALSAPRQDQHLIAGCARRRPARVCILADVEHADSPGPAASRRRSSSSIANGTFAGIAATPLTFRRIGGPRMRS